MFKNGRGPDVTGFHVPGTGFQQQGGGAGPPSAPQLRAIHHPHHGGNPQIPPPHQQPPPPQAQSQHTGGPPGPAPTSTPPGPADMGKQGPPHMQQGGQMPLNFVPNQSRAANSQPFFPSGPRGPTPRMPSHRNQVVNMQPSSVGQQLFSQHVQMPPVQMFGQQVIPTQIHTPQMYVQSQVPVYGGQPRHQNHTGSGYFQQAGPQQILMPQAYPVFSHPTQSPQYYYQGHVGLRPGAAVTGGPGPGGLAGAASQQVMPGGGPPAQLGQPGAPVAMSIVSGPGMAGVPGLATGDASTGQTTMTVTTGKQTRRKHAIDIVDPKTMKTVEIYEASTTSSSTPPRSGESSARDTPQPNTGLSATMDVAAEFAARVAKAASESSPPPSAPSVVQVGPPPYVESPPQMVTANGPDTSGTNSISVSEGIPQGSILTQGDALPISNQQIVVVEEPVNLAPTLAPPTISPVAATPTTWKQGQLPHSTSTSLSSTPSGNISKNDISNQVVVEERVRPSILEIEHEVVDFVPSVSAADAISPTPLVSVVDPELTPVVSAQTNAPVVEVIRGTPNREQFPALKNNIPISHHSPRRKQQSQSQRPETTSSVPQATPIVSSPPIQTHPLNLSVSRETTPVTETKGSKKTAPIEESTPPSSAFPVSQPPKEKRDQEKQHGRDREKPSSVSSQGRGEREKSTSSTSSSSSQHHGRDREKSSRDKEKSGTGSQGGPKDREKSASQGRDRDKSSSKEATPTPSPVTPNIPTVVPQTTLQPQSEQQTPVRPVAAVEEPKQQTNGEVSAAETVDGKASQHRSKPKQRNHKMRDINRKGAEKEGGTDMDAFVETPPEEATPPPPPPPAVTPPVSQPPPVPAAPTNKVATDNQIVQEEETEADKEEKLVAARNEENAKVSAAALKEESSSATPVIENIPATKPTTLQLRHTYKEDQWSPLNPEGKKKYERDFLMELQNDPQSKKKPDNLPDIEVVLKDSTNRRQADRSHPNMNRPIPERLSHDTFAPGFMRTPNTRGQPLPKRNSQQGNKPNKGSKSNVIHVTLSLEEVKLHESDNAWKPTRMKGGANNEQEAKTEELYKKVRGVLNKLTPQKFHTLVTQVQALPIDNSDRLQGVINLVFEKAVDEPNFSVAYAQMCKVLSGMQVPAERKNKDVPEYVNFRKLLVNRCQMEFEKDKEEELNKEAKLRNIEAATDPEKKKELQLNFEEEERRVRMKSVGNIRFIGELFKLGMLTTNIMQRCIKHLLQDGSEESLECLCKLLTTIGKDLENKNQDLSQYFETMKNISLKKGEVSSRVRFMLQDVIDLRRNKWVPRRDDSNPKTMDQIQKEAEKESFDQQLLLNSAPQTPRRQDDRVPQNRKNKGNMGDDGWNMVAPARTSRYTVDTTKLRASKEETLAPRLGGNYLFTSFIGGANTKKDMNKNPLSTGMVQHNFFSALSDTSSEDSKRPQQPPVLSNRPSAGKTTPSPSMEKERMLSSFRPSLEGDNWQSRSGGSRSSSRDNSARRGGDELSLRSYAPSSQPSSIYASSEDISSSGMTPDAKNQPVAATTVLSTEEVQKKTLALLEEFLYNTNYKESANCVTETFPTENRSMFVRESLNDMLERSSSARENVGRLMSRLVEDGIITLPLYLAGLNEFLEFADDIAIDVPKFWPYIAEFIVPMLVSEVMTFRNFQEISHPVHGNLILEVLQLLVRDKGPGWIREKWQAADLKWTDFLPADKVDDFVKKNKLEYILGGTASTPSPSSSAALSWDHVKQKLEQFLKPEQASSSSFDQICDWIGANVGDRAKEPQFIRALMTAICRSAIESQKTTLKLNESHFQEQQKLLLRYVDNKEELELQCLYAVQSLINQLEHPQGLLCQIYQALWDDSTISSDSFIAWQNSNDPAEQAGKGVALKSLTTFFTALCEGEEDSSCEDS